MPGNQSNSIDDLLGKKREGEPALTPEVTPVDNTTEAPVPEPKMPVPENVPKTLAEQITGRENETPEEAEGPSATTARAAAVTGKTQATPSAGAKIPSLQTIKSLPQDEQVKVLTEIVMTKGLDNALAIIKRLHNPYLYDLLHDTLVDELYQRLQGPKLKE
jgi:hypothetical protein